MDFSLFDCPDCKLPLRAGNQALHCSSCGREFPVDDGLPNFCKTDIYWGEVDTASSDRLLRETERTTWRDAVETVLADRPDLVEYCTDTRRANFLQLIPPSRRGTLLDIGTGWGSIASAAATLFKNVYAIEPVSVRARFSHLRFRQEARDNITPARASLLDLPFARPEFDVIILNGILEWVGDWNRTLPPERAQETTLRTLRGLLKPGGFLVVGIENRFGYTFFRGRKDHNGLWGTNLLPRVAASAVSLLRKRERYRVYTYSAKGLRKLLRGAGFDDMEFFAPLPGYNRPFSILSLESPGPLRHYITHFAGGHSALRRLANRAAATLAAAGAMKHLVPDFLVFARRPVE